jgi:hypothetical protein
MLTGNLVSLLAGIPERERAAHCRELRALALVYLGLRHPATIAPAEAVADPAAGPRALALLDAVPALPRRRLLSAYGALMAPSGRMTTPGDRACLWCGRPFRTRRGGSPQRFCSTAHRTAFWSASRLWAERAVAAGVLTLDQIRKGAPEACTLLSAGIPPAPIAEPRNPAHVASAQSPGAAQGLLYELLWTLLRLPGDEWLEVTNKLPAELVNRICDFIEASAASVLE